MGRLDTELKSPIGYMPELDTFRALAIFSVMCIHWLPTGSMINRLQGQTSNGVHLFFVLSGFLITRILLKSRAAIELGHAAGHHSLKQFYARRFLRIFPAYYLALAVGVIFHFTGVREGIWWHVSYLSNFYYYFRQHFDGPASLFWTLAVEEQFYLIWPLTVLFLPKRAIFPFTLSVAILGTVFRTNALLEDTGFKILLPACMNFLAIGALVAVVQDPICGSAPMRKRLLQSFGSLIVLLACCSVITMLKLGAHAAMGSRVIRAFDQPMISMIYACVFAWISTGSARWARPVLCLPPLVYLGRISYGLYLYHLFVTFGLKRGQHWLAAHIGEIHAFQLTETFAARFVVTVIVASASWFLFEKPINDLKAFFPYRSSPSERNSVVNHPA